MTPEYVCLETAITLKTNGFPQPSDIACQGNRWSLFYTEPNFGENDLGLYSADRIEDIRSFSDPCEVVAYAATATELLPHGWVLKRIGDEWEASPDDNIESYPIMKGGVFPRPTFLDKNPHEAAAKAWLHLARLREFKPGDKVTFNPPGARKGEREKGIVKRVHPIADAIWVVFNCGEDWDNFANYTAQLVKIQDLGRLEDNQLEEGPVGVHSCLPGRGFKP